MIVVRGLGVAWIGGGGVGRLPALAEPAVGRQR